MREGKHPEGSMVLRSKVDMSSRNINLRDPAIYRIRFAEHHRTGDKWCIYPMYTFAHPLEDVLENITHSICTLEFEDQRAFYNWATERSVPITRAPLFEKAKAVLADLQKKSFEEIKPFAEAAVKFKWKLGQTETERELASLLADIKANPENLNDASAHAIVNAVAAKPEVFTPLLQDVLSATVKPNFFLLPHQYEFNRLNLTYVVMSKRKLIALVKEGLVDGWDDPRMPTICALRRKGYTPASVRNFAEMVGVAKRDNVIDLGKLEFCVREDLNKVAERRMAVLNPLKVVITNYPEGKTELFTAINNPEDESAGTRQVPFSREIYIERDDFMEVPPKKYYRLSPGTEVRLRYSYLIRCEEVVKDAEGNITELRCTYDPESGNGSSSDGRRVKGVIHWVSAADAIEAEIRLFNPLFKTEDPDDVAEGGSWEDNLNPDSMIVTRGYLEPSLKEAPIGQPFQFERVGYFCADTDSKPGHPVFNRTVTLKDSWAKINK